MNVRGEEGTGQSSRSWSLVLTGRRLARCRNPIGGVSEI